MHPAIVRWWATYKHGMPNEPILLSMKCMPQTGETIYLEFFLCEHVPLFTKGAQKGRPNFKRCVGKKLVAVPVTERDRIIALYEEVTGKCKLCHGKGQEWAGWDHKSGDRYRDCKRCGCTGNAPKDTATCAT